MRYSEAKEVAVYAKLYGESVVQQVVETALVRIDDRGARKAKTFKRDEQGREIVTGETNTAELLRSQVEAFKIAAEVRPESQAERDKRRRAAGIPDQCDECGKALGMSDEARRRRDYKGHPWACRDCAVRKVMTPELRKQQGKNLRETLAKMEPERLRERLANARLSLTPEKLSEFARRSNSMVSERRDNQRRELSAKMTPEQRVYLSRTGVLAREIRRWAKSNDDNVTKDSAPFLDLRASLGVVSKEIAREWAKCSEVPAVKVGALLVCRRADFERARKKQ